MYEKGEYIVHPGQGVCRVEGVSEEPDPVYRLMPVGDRHSLLISFPVASESRLRPVLSRDEALAVIDGYPSLEVDDFTDHSGMVEEQHFRHILKEGTCGDSVRVVKTFRRRIRRAREDGRRPSVVYERILRDAQDRSLSELAVALGTTADDVVRLFREREGEHDAES